MNLLMNAAQAIEEKGEILIKTACQKDEMMVEIRDTGKGIPEEQLGKIFDPGFTTKGVGVGTGLGLSIVHQIIERHEGRIEVKSQVGQGSSFTIWLRMAPLDSSTPLQTISYCHALIVSGSSFSKASSPPCGIEKGLWLNPTFRVVSSNPYMG